MRSGRYYALDDPGGVPVDVRDRYDGVVLRSVTTDAGIEFEYEVRLSWDAVDHGSDVNVELPSIRIETGSIERVAASASDLDSEGDVA